jgi:general secretion pathway protein A
VYTEFFGLNEKPFSITPDPRYLYLTRRHAEALAHLIYGIKESGGFIQLTGEVGTGKTTLIRSLLEQLPEKVKIAVILNPNLTTREFLETICRELHILLPPKASRSTLIDMLNKFLLRAHSEGTRVVLIVDEAQTLDVELLEQVRLLTNLETARQKLLQIILIGQPELREVFQRPDMRQIAQRITGRYHLEPLRRDETAAYVSHRMRVAGAHGEVFKPSAVRELFRQASGIPRLINVVADRALLAAYTMDLPRINGRLVHRAAGEVFGKPRRRWWPYAVVCLSLVSLSATSLFALRNGSQTETSVAARTPRPTATVEAPSLESAQSDPAPPELAALLQSQRGATDAATAFGRLFELWDIDADAGDPDACLYATRQGLACLTLTDGSIRQLRGLARPTVLALVDDEDTVHHVLLTGIGYDEVEIVIGDETSRVRLADLAQHWRGTHTLFWRPNAAAGRLLRPGMQGEGVRWLRTALTGLQPGQDGEGGPQVSDTYDEDLERLVRDFQREKWLQVDGIAGAQTQIALATELNVPGVPILRRSH